jgi:hypothetical protein
LKEVIYNTDTKFVYSINETPAYDGSGDISYITNSRLAIGNVHSVRVVNTGEGYNLVPIVSGVVPTAVNEAAVEAVWDPARQVVTGFTITDQGDNYSKPAIILTDTDGQRYEYVCEQYNGKLSKVEVLNEGIGFTYQPTARIIESDVKIYLESTNIGVPQNVKINNPGRGYNNDDSLLGSYKSPTTFVLRNINGTFSGGEKIRQSGLPNTTAIVARDGFREGSNLLRVVSINGVFDTGSTIESVLGNRTATLYAQVSTEFEPDIRSYVDNFGFYGSDRGKLSNANQRLQDSYFYQDYSYVIRSKTSITEWRDLIKKTTHPAGFQMFGEMVIESQAASPMPVSQPSLNYVTTVELPPVQITSLSTKRLLTLTQYKLEQLKVEEGRGSISIDTFDATETVTYNVSLSPAFDGTFDPSTGNLIGNTEFTLIDKKNGLALQLTKDEQLICSLDGIFQEPGKAFTISGNKITFAEPPLGARVVEGQDVDPVKFYGRAIKFKESTLNDRYFRKIKSIADQFDGVKTDFSLYWEDGTVVKTDVSENLIVGLNGVIQKARTTETEPFGNAYSIIRDSDENVADIIRFTKPPIDNEDLYGPPEELPEILKNYEQCFIYSIGSYERLKINSDLYEYRFGGPYLIQDEVTNSVRKVDDPKYALVFIDGVLQRDTDSYTIVGPNITFTKPLQFSENSAGNRAVQDVNIILMYGRDVAKTLTFYDFEPFAYNNTIFVTFRGTGIGDRMRGQLDQFSGQNFHLKQGNTVIGKVQNVTRKTPDEVVLTIKSPVNVTVDENTPFSICVVEDMYNPVLITGTYTTSATYKVDDEGLRLLEKDVPSWLYGVEGGNAAWGNRNSMFANLLPGDKILIDGESEYREIVRTPDQVYTKSFVAGDYIQNEHYAKVQATNYEGDTEGEGLSVTCNVNAFGAVTTLNVADVEFNQRDLTLYFDEGILLQPTAYEYFTTPEVHFIPVDGNGGGAKAEVIAYGGQILDVVLTEGGSGYTQPPRVVVARRYKRIKELNRKIDTLIRINVQTDIESVFSMIGQTEVRIEGGPFSPQAISSIVSFGGFDPELNTNRDITQIINTLHGEERQVRMTDEKFVTEARVQSPAVLLENVFTLQEDLILTQVIGGVVGFEALATLETITTEEVNKIIQIRANKAFEPKGIPTSGGLGTFVDAPVSDTSTIIYAANTQGFPDTPARILIGGEYIYYRRKEDDRFLDVVRGYQGTTAIAHNPGDLILSQPEFTVLLSGGVNTILSEGSVAQSSVTSIQKTVEIQPIIEPIDTFTDINEIKQSIDLENEVILERVDKQITIIPPTSYNIVTETHATHSRVFKASAGLSDVFGVNGEVLTAGPEVTEIQLTQAQQIEVDNTSTVSSVTIGSVAATATSTSKVVTTSYESTVVTNTVAFDVLSTLTAVSTQVVENPQTRIDSVSSNIVTFTNLNLNRVALREVQTVQQPFVMHRTSDVVTSVQDIDTEFTTISMVLGGVNATASGGTEIDYRYAIVDFIIEEYVLEEYIFQRNGNQVFLLDPYNEVIRRDGSSFIVENRSQNSPPGFEDYNLGNVGLTLGAFETNAKVDSGIASGLTIADVDAIYPTLNIRDFDFRAESALLGNGDRFNLGIPTYQQPMSEVVSGIDINGEMTLDSNEYFPTSGHIIIRNNSGLYIDTLSVISYTGKSGTDTLTGCQLERGDSSPTGGDLATPFSIV